jgi:hypothetical protein
VNRGKKKGPGFSTSRLAAEEWDAVVQGVSGPYRRSKKRRLVDPIGQAKTAETRQRRIDKAIDALRENRT